MRIYIDMDNVLCDYNAAHKKALFEEPGIKYPQSQFGFFANLQPIPNAVESVFELSKSNEVYILTAPSIHNPLSYVEKRVWVEKWLGIEFVERLIISPNKGLFHGDILIDDHSDGNGQELFQGKLIHFGSGQYPTWAVVLTELTTN
ncbi:5' nucleotidase, NT5C type [Pseudoalteromonas sp. SSMSWG5]|uniref:5' nucleotidase, NT5C type n=1 Tax=Pseudoalteromonas sp. SSMSWG5 TaxID=3139396 RepID=UPI003BA9B7E0